MSLRTLLLYFLVLSVGSFQACSCDDSVELPDTTNPDMQLPDEGLPDQGLPDQDTPDQPETQDPCSEDLNPCRADEVCTSGADLVAVCACPAGTSEVEGICVEDTECTPTTCGQGTCQDSENGPVCTCEAGWTGDFCDSCDAAGGWQPDGMGGCTDDPCSLIVCGEKVCEVDQDGTAACVCPAGTHEEGTSCEPDRECLPTSCNMHGTCDDTGGVVACQCDEGFAGESCSECDALGGYHPDGAGGCTTDPCLPNPCSESNKNACTANGTSYTCSCNPGFHLEGNNCVVDEVCENGSCSGNGACSDVGGVVTCACDTGYAGDSCDSCDTASGYHLDGMGGCTTDPCLPNPCSMMENKTQCVSQGTGYMCECDAGFHPDGLGGCTDDPCTPNTCAANNQACRVTAGQAECYTPECNDNNPCTEDTLVNGQCVYNSVADGTACSTGACQVNEVCGAGSCGGGSARVCDDANPCTTDTCDQQTGCVFTVDDSNVPDDGIACTEDVCSSGFASNTPSNALCDDSLFCNGEELCAPADPNANASGCITQNIPTAPPSPGPCSYYGACDEGSESFPLMTRATGASCNDGIYCSVNDVCDAAGACRGTLVSDCSLPTTCDTSSPFSGTIDIPQATITLNVTLGGQPLSASGSDSTSHMIYAVARDTGAKHQISRFYWDSYYTPNLRRTDAERLMPGTYDILYRKGETSTDSGYVSSTDSYDIGPNGVRILAEGVTVYAGHNTLDIDIPQTTLTVNLTLGGQSLPSSGSDSTSHMVYAVSKDTGAKHQISRFYWDSYYTPNLRRTDAERLMPGTYDILYRKGETSTDSGFVSRTDTYDIGPNGVRYLARDVVISGAFATLNVDIPQTEITLDITLGGQPLPSSGSDSTSHFLYAVSRDTGVRHQISGFYWDSYYTPNLRRTDAIRLIPGTYDILYRKGETSTDSKFVSSTDTYDIGPNGLRYLAYGVQISGTSQSLSVDIPQTEVTLNITLDGQPLPSSGSDSTSHMLYAVSKDTGARHQISRFYWDSYYTPNLRRTDGLRLIPGTYDILYRKGETSPDSGYVSSTDTYDIGPNGVRYLARDVEVSGTSQTLDINIDQSPVTLNIKMNGQPLPSAGSDSTSHMLYAVSKDTGVKHQISRFYWDSYYTPNLRRTDALRLMPGTYDILYRKGETSTDSGFVSSTDSYDIGPNGVRYLARDVVVQVGMSQMIDIDIPQTPITFDITLADQPLSDDGSDSTSHMVYAVSRDTGARHQLSRFYWDSYYTPNLRRTDAERLMPGVYDILYRKGDSSDSGYVSSTDSYDIGPNGVRYLGVCLEFP